jgi:hypothetical protein
MISKFVSPTRTYIVFVKDLTDPAREELRKITISNLYENNIIGAKNYFFDNYFSSSTVTRCLPLEAHVEEIHAREKEMTGPPQPSIFDKPQSKSIDIDKVFNSDLIHTSPSRTYVLFIDDETVSNKEHHYRLVVPEPYGNDEIEAMTFYFDYYDHFAEINKCLTYEEYTQQNSAKDLEEPKVTNPKFRNQRTDHSSLTPSHQKKLIGDIKKLLGDYYGANPYLMSDEQILDLMKQMKEENIKYISALSSAKAALGKVFKFG